MTDPSSLPVQVWPTAEGVLYFPSLSGLDLSDGVAAVLAVIPPGSAVVVQDTMTRDGLLERGAQQVRHLYAMRHGLRDVPDGQIAPGIVLRPWRRGDAERLAPALVAAYGDGHPDRHPPDLDVAAQTLTRLTEDPDNPLIEPAAQVAEVGGEPVGAAVVVRSEHIDGWKGPWVMNVFRAPDIPVPGIGVAMLSRAMTVLREAGQRQLGLAVTAANPARHVYERLGFTSAFEGWVVVLPGS